MTISRPGWSEDELREEGRRLFMAILKHRPRFRKSVRIFDFAGCWEWAGVIGWHGYGHTTHNGKTCRAHSLIYKLAISPIPDGFDPDHLCRNRACVNPLHIEVVTKMENWLRGNSCTANNLRKTHCLYGHPFSGDNLRLYRSSNGRPKRMCVECDRIRYTKRNALRKNIHHEH